MPRGVSCSLVLLEAAAKSTERNICEISHRGPAVFYLSVVFEGNLVWCRKFLVEICWLFIPPPPSRGGYLTFCLAIDCVHSRKGETSVRLLFRVVGSGFLTRPAVFSQPSWRVWVGWLCLHVAERFKRVAAAHTYPPLLSGANKTSTRFTRSRTSLESNSWQVFATRHGHETIGALAAPSEESEKSPHHTYDAQRACYFRAVL